MLLTAVVPDGHCEPLIAVEPATQPQPTEGEHAPLHVLELKPDELPKYPDQRITRILQTSRMCKGRLLHYFPSDHGGACAFMYLSK